MFGTVGELRKAIRNTSATIFNRSPLSVNEQLPGIHPSYVILPAPKRDEGMTNYCIENAVYYIYLDADRPQMEKPVPADELAYSILEGLYSSWPYVTTNARPALFFLPGQWTNEAAEREYQNQIKELDEKQMAWYQVLLEQGDGMYARANRDPRVITILHREAASRLGAKREWAFNMDPDKRCPFCAAPVIFNAVICRECKEVINPEAYRRLKAEMGVEAVLVGTQKTEIVPPSPSPVGTVGNIVRATEPEIKSNVPVATGAITKEMVKNAPTSK